VYREKALKTDAVQMHDRDASALREQLKAKDDRILQLEEVNLFVLFLGGSGARFSLFFLPDCDNNFPPCLLCLLGIVTVTTWIELKATQRCDHKSCRVQRKANIRTMC